MQKLQRVAATLTPQAKVTVTETKAGGFHTMPSKWVKEPYKLQSKEACLLHSSKFWNQPQIITRTALQGGQIESLWECKHGRLSTELRAEPSTDHQWLDRIKQINGDSRFFLSFSGFRSCQDLTQCRPRALWRASLQSQASRTRFPAAPPWWALQRLCPASFLSLCPGPNSPSRSLSSWSDLKTEKDCLRQWGKEGRESPQWLGNKQWWRICMEDIGLCRETA